MLNKSKINVGDTHSEVVVEDLKRTQIVQYAGASGDYNPLHSDEIFTTKVVGYPSVFAHGMLSMGLTGKMLTNYVGDASLKNSELDSQIKSGLETPSQAKLL
jgi:acyl dehydratase